MSGERVEDYDFELPAHLIAQRPSDRRGESRLMRVSAAGEVSFGRFGDVLDAFEGGEVLVLNDARVVPARLYGRKETGGQVEVFFLEPAEEGGGGLHIRALTRGRLQPGQPVSLPLGVTARLVAREEGGVARLSLEGGALAAEGSAEQGAAEQGAAERLAALWGWLEQAGQLPLPPYITRAPDDLDRERYQTVYASAPGAVAAPTAGLHFTAELLDALRAKGVEVHTLTLVVGPGTFAPVKASRVEEHVMHTERYAVPAATREAVDRAAREGRAVVAVGTTVVRALESCAADPRADRTQIFITPGYRFRVIDGLITNFHLPKSTLLMLVSAFAGHDVTLRAYARAVAEGLRFYSYGDASLFRRPGGRWA
ncbi:MAG: tRNA preQ1(34) S-adenosylmethionine ribosyltransferase-isomerase QueA [Deltaproteobacteria bacterium]|nr:tRNA preQ1(34) S-adenosylmethionine ribosyltransferase-isomerase QueA [Deltaproteobacteria bacterium]